MGLKRFCSKAGCKTLIEQGTNYCPKHITAKKAETKERNHEYDTHIRNQKAKTFYNSTDWKMARKKALIRDNGIDIFLYVKEKKIVPADTVHHITELGEDYSKRCDIDNLISVSEKTHSMISKAYKTNKKEALQQTLRECIRAAK